MKVFSSTGGRVQEVDVESILLGNEFRVQTTALPSSQWVKILRDKIQECRPYLKHLRSFESVGQFIDRQNLATNEWKNAPVLPPEINLKTRIIMAARFQDVPPPDKVEFCLDKSSLEQRPGLKKLIAPKKYHLKQLLLLTDQGMLVQEFAPFSNKEEPFCEWLEFRIVDELKLKELIDQSHGYVADLLVVLEGLFREGIKLRKKQLKQLKGQRRGIKKLIKRMVVMVPCSKCRKAKERHGKCECEYDKK